MPFLAPSQQCQSTEGNRTCTFTECKYHQYIHKKFTTQEGSSKKQCLPPSRDKKPKRGHLVICISLYPRSICSKIPLCHLCPSVTVYERKWILQRPVSVGTQDRTTGGWVRENCTGQNSMACKGVAGFGLRHSGMRKNQSSPVQSQPHARCKTVHHVPTLTADLHGPKHRTCNLFNNNNNTTMISMAP